MTKREHQARGTADERRRRLGRLIEVLFGGNQRSASRASGVSQAQISRVLRGERSVTEGILEAFAGLPAVNPDWVFAGEGELLLPSTAGTLPVSDVILPGLPDEHPGLLTGERHPVAPSFEDVSRYWLRLSPSSPIVVSLQPRFLPGDLLLVESDRAHLDRLDAVDQQLCAVRLRREPNIDYQLGQVLVDGRTIRARLFDSGGSWAPQMGVSTDPLVPNPRKRAIGSLKRRGSDQATAKKTRPSAPKASTDEGMYDLADLRDVVGIVLRLERLPALP